MPIVLAPASPVAPEISAAAGAAEQFTRFAPVLQRQQEAVANAYARQQELGARYATANADRGQRAAEFGAEQTQRRGLEENRLGQQATLFQAEQQNRAAAQDQQIRAREAEQRDHFERQVQLQNMEWTHKDDVELKRLKMGQRAIMDNPNFTAEERADLLTQFATKIDPMDRRLVATRMAQEKLQNQQMQQKIGEADLIATQRAEFLAGRLQAVTKDVTDAEGNVLGSMMMIPGEKPHWIDKKPGKEEQAAAAQQAAQMKHEQVAQKHGQDRSRFRAEMKLKIADRFDKWAEANKDDPSKKAAINAREGNIKEELAEIMREYDEDNPRPQAQVQQGGEHRFKDVGRQGAPDEPPLTTPDAKPTPKQAAQLSVMGKIASVFDAVQRDQGRTHPEEGEARKELAKAEALFRKYGDPLNMPEAARRDYVDSVEKAGKLAKKFRDRTTPPPARTPQAPPRPNYIPVREGT